MRTSGTSLKTNMADAIVNKVSQSGIITLDLSEIIPPEKTEVFDIKDYLFQGFVLKEKEFREKLKSVDWTSYKNKNVALFSSANAIIPTWAYMLITSYLQPHAKNVVFGDESVLQTIIIRDTLSKLDLDEFKDKRVVIKGCGDERITEAAYVEISRLLLPVVKALMYGEPCSTVPVFKRKT